MSISVDEKYWEECDQERRRQVKRAETAEAKVKELEARFAQARKCYVKLTNSPVFERGSDHAAYLAKPTLMTEFDAAFEKGGE